VSRIIKEVVNLESIRFLVLSCMFMKGNELKDKECVRREEVFVDC